MTIPNETTVIDDEMKPLEENANGEQVENASEESDGEQTPTEQLEEQEDEKKEEGEDKPPMSLEDRAFFAERRREKEAATKALNDFVKVNYAGYIKPITGEAIETADDVEDFKSQLALQQEIEKGTIDSVSAQRQLFEQQKQRLLENDPEIMRMREENEAFKMREAKSMMERDLMAIQKLNPAVKSLEQLGDDFIKMIAAGVEATVAYNAVAVAREKSIPSPGDIGSNQGKKGSFFTREEVEAMSLEQVEKNLDKILESQTKWK